MLPRIFRNQALNPWNMQPKHKETVSVIWMVIWIWRNEIMLRWLIQKQQLLQNLCEKHAFMSTGHEVNFYINSNLQI